MLIELSIKNFAIIEALSLSFRKGLTVLTGETGAGKSIIIDAINLLAGGRGSSEFVRHGEDKAELEGLFSIDESKHPVKEKAEEFGIDISEGMIVLRRDISESGKSICRVNGKLVTLAILREIGRSLIDIHGQHEHQELMDNSFHLPLLDQFGGEKITKALQDYQSLYKKYDELTKQWEKLNQNEQQMAHRLDLIKFQVEEIQRADLKLNEDDELLEEKKKINNFERIYEGLTTAYQSLRGEQRAMDWLARAMDELEEAAALDLNYKSSSEQVSNSFYILEEVASSIRSNLDLLEYDPERLEMIESRLNELNGLKRKYGKNIEDILDYFHKIEAEMETIQNREVHVNQLEKEMDKVKSGLLLKAATLSKLRQSFANKLTTYIHQELKELYMEKTVFEVRFLQMGNDSNVETVNIRKNGLDEVEFYISTNPGEPLKPLSKVASGGELSRIMLALKNIFSKHQGITSIIFDEVDTGVSGRVAQSIGEKIYRVAVDSQVLCISHLPQVAALADTHLFISKEMEKGRTRTSVKALNEEEQIKEIGRMISGVEITELTKQHAKELLEQAGLLKERFVNLSV
ncbi:DNA repair protein RecN [Peribacillus alkalitolerans]|uniref:DNA repair protein RecN n=1 Tax=Peribacillus alkalitolerans TaxID=1550385 RepID=UPI0013D77598|nr:DNA repair protein RecN [Peribacillus alkalitolerans]